MNLRIGVVGAGGFGRAIALASTRHGHEVVLWSRRDREVPDPIRVSTDMDDIRDCELIFLAVPARHAVEVTEQLGEVVDGRHAMVHVSRGLLGAELKTITQLIRDKTVCRRLGALAGPLVADALAEGRPSEVVPSLLIWEEKRNDHCANIGTGGSGCRDPRRPGVGRHHHHTGDERPNVRYDPRL